MTSAVVHFSYNGAPPLERGKAACGKSNVRTSNRPAEVTCQTARCRLEVQAIADLIRIAGYQQHEAAIHRGSSSEVRVRLGTPSGSDEIEVLALPERPLRWTPAELHAVRAAVTMANETVNARATLKRRGISWTG